MTDVTKAITDGGEYTTYPCFVTGNKDMWMYMNFEKGHKSENL